MKSSILLLFLLVTLSVGRAQDITPQGAGPLKLGMGIQQFKAAFPGALVKKESHEGEDETVGIIVRDGRESAKAIFYNGKVYALNLYDKQYKINGISIGALFQDLRRKIKIQSIFYAPDGEEAGITIQLKDIPGVVVHVELMGALKSMLGKYAYNEVPVDKLPDWSKVGSVSITQTQISK